MIVAYIPDLLFGSRVVSGLSDYEVKLVSTPEVAGASLLIVDLTADAAERIASLPADRPPTLAFYSHVENNVREAALAAGIEMVVPRSRMAREGPELVARLLSRP